ncbi:MAG: GGDEF domain-containing protein [Clostridiales bacterium]|jgi:diguanylate cyclase (GGDEF)-like protein|nr:GGDEF domain-containing protein [Clostridiales bacterium]
MMDYNIVHGFAQGLLEDMPAFVVIADSENGMVLMQNSYAERIFGAINRIDEAASGNTLQFNAGERIDNRFEYNSNINGSWYWISHYATDWIGMDSKAIRAEIFIGVDYMRVKNNMLLNMEALSSESQGPVNAVNQLEKQVRDYKNGIGATFSVVYADINDVKTINETGGEQAGDEYVSAVIKVIKSSIRGTDIFVHIGGDDFLLIFPKCHQRVCENIMAAMVNKLDIMNSERDTNYSISYGVLEVNNSSLADVDTIMGEIVNRMRKMKEMSVMIG